MGLSHQPELSDITGPDNLYICCHYSPVRGHYRDSWTGRRVISEDMFYTVVCESSLDGLSSCLVNRRSQVQIQCIPPIQLQPQHTTGTDCVRFYVRGDTVSRETVYQGDGAHLRFPSMLETGLHTLWQWAKCFHTHSQARK